MSSIQLYNNEQFSVRTITDPDGTVWFVARDIMTALEYSEASTPAQVMQSVPDCWAGIKRIDSRSENGVVQERDMLCLTEQGVYFFLGRSDKPKALPYQMWIAGDVVPSIRETGGYSARHNPQLSLKDTIEGAKIILETADLKGNQITLALDKLYRRCTGISLLETTGIQLVSPVQHQALTPTEIGARFSLSARRINEILAGAGYQNNINGHWEATELGRPYALILDTNKRHSDGTPVTQLKWYSTITAVVEQLLDASA